MENKINIAELLKDCPKGMELDCTAYEGIITLDEVTNSESYPIKVNISYGNGSFAFATLSKYGQTDGTTFNKCVIFPKGKITWEGFTPPCCKFEDGDILAYTRRSHTTVFIYRNKDSEPKFTTSFYVGYTIGVCYHDFHIYNQSTLIALNDNCDDVRLATEEEKQKLFQAIEENGYKWNAETKTLEKLIESKFKIGNWYQCTKDFFGKGVTFDKNTTYYCAKEGCLQDEYRCHIAIIKDLYDNFKLWTIQDAKDGDVLAAYECLVLFKKLDGLNIKCYCTYHFMNNPSFYVDTLQNKDAFHPATKEEKQKLFDAIKAEGYHWNSETKTLEKLPKFKVGDKVKYKNTNICKCIKRYNDILNYYVTSDDYIINLEKQDDWKLIPNKFDITTLKPFESRVLVRNVNGDLWKPAIYGFSHSNGCYVVGGVYWGQCIPYDVNKELLGTTNNPEDYGSR